MKRDVLALTFAIGIVGISGCVSADSGNGSSNSEIPDQFVDYFVCVDSNASLQIRRGRKDYSAAINEAIDNCPSEFNKYVDYITLNALRKNGVKRLSDSDPIVRKTLSDNIRSQTVERLLPIYQKAVK